MFFCFVIIIVVNVFSVYAPTLLRIDVRLPVSEKVRRRIGKF